MKQLGVIQERPQNQHPEQSGGKHKHTCVCVFCNLEQVHQ